MTLDASSLHVISCIYNPVRWQSRISLAIAWARHMVDSGAKVTLVECLLGARQSELVGKLPDEVEHITVRATTLSWNKETLLNLALERSKYRTPYIAWVDADVAFHKPTWAEDTVHALQQYAVVQPWASALDLGPNGEPMMVKGVHVHTSFAKVWHDNLEVKNWHPPKGPYGDAPAYAHCGYAWAIRRDVLNNIGGLIEVSGLGAGDHQMAMAFIGQIENSIHGKTSPGYQAAIRAWAERAWKYVQGNVGFVNTTLSHHWHGPKELRRYHERWSILIEEGFDPVTDIKRNLDGVIELAGNKPRMAHRFDQYFRERNEDQNSRCGE